MQLLLRTAEFRIDFESELIGGERLLQRCR
jgi:hypothetical protein